MEKSAHRQFALDGMRGVAALTVFAIHLWIYQLPNSMTLRRGSWATTALFEGRVAFVMFFVLSGYLLYRGFARAALGRSDPVSIVGYVARRAARIGPAYYVAVVGSVLCISFAGDGTPGRRLVDLGDLPLFLGFAQNYSPATLLKLNAATWTLSVEVAFYALLPVLGVLALRLRSARRQAMLLGTLVIAGLGWNLTDYLSGWGAVAGHSLPALLPYFACGMLVAVGVEQARAHDRAVGPAASAALSAMALLLLIANGVWHAVDHRAGSFAMEVFADLGAAVAFSALIASLAIGTGAGLGWLAWRPLAWIGTITYGLYLWHIPVIVFARGHGLLPGGALSAVVALPVSVALGAGSWYLLEKPLMNRAARLGRTRGRPRPLSEARFERSRSRSRARIAPQPASWSARAVAERR
jgi:peptidoglycan/LPS O-acetylase OafA/YrhL